MTPVEGGESILKISERTIEHLDRIRRRKQISGFFENVPVTPGAWKYSHGLSVKYSLMQKNTDSHFFDINHRFQVISASNEFLLAIERRLGGFSNRVED